MVCYCWYQAKAGRHQPQNCLKLAPIHRLGNIRCKYLWSGPYLLISLRWDAHKTQTRCYRNKEHKLRDLYPILRISASDPRAHFMPDKVVPKFPIVIIAIFLDPWLLRKIPRICSVISTLVGAVKVGVILGAGMPERECLATRFPLERNWN